jgi:hypothetical protein
MTFAMKRWQRDFEEWKKAVTVRDSENATETASWLAGFGFAVEKPEGTPTSSDEMIQGPTKTWYHKSYGLKFSITEEAIADDRRGVMKQGMANLTDSMKATRSLLAMRPYTSAFATTYHATADGKALCAADHVLYGGGSYSNTLGAAADPNAATIEAAIYNYEHGITDDRGKRYTRKAKQILCGPSQEWDFRRVMESAYDIGLAVNTETKNLVKAQGLTLVVNNEISDDSWFVLGEKDPDVGTVFFSRVNPRLTKDQDKDTGNYTTYAYMRFSIETADPRNVYGVPA